jgi:hypothetical protein
MLFLAALESQRKVIMQVGINMLRELQSQTQEELDSLLPSMLRPSATIGRAFKGELRKDLTGFRDTFPSRANVRV